MWISSTERAILFCFNPTRSVNDGDLVSFFSGIMKKQIWDLHHDEGSDDCTIKIWGNPKMCLTNEDMTPKIGT